MLREKAIEAGVILSFRTFLGFFITTIGTITLARLLSLKIYGLYGVVSFWLVFLAGFIDLGISVFLIRKPETINDRDIKVAFTILHTLALVILFITVGVLSPLLSRWYKEKELFTVMSISSLVFYLGVWAKVPLAILERDLEYKKISTLELLSSISYYISAITAAYYKFGIYALVIGDISRSILTTVLSLTMKKVKFGLLWDKDRLCQMLKYGLNLSSSSWIWQINTAIAPTMVGKIVGLEAVGILKIAYMIASQLSFFRSIIWRISFPVITKIQLEKEKVLKAISDGGFYQVLLLVFPSCGFISLSYWLVPFLYGQKWSGVSEVLLFACLPLIIDSIFSLHKSSLYVSGRVFAVTKFNIIYTLCLWLISYLTISKFGYLGLPIAEILVSPTYFFLHKAVISYFGNLDYWDVFLFLAISYVSSIFAYSIQIPILSILIFLIPTSLVIFIDKKVKAKFLEALSSFKIIQRF